jgi:hypothetical protein
MKWEVGSGKWKMSKIEKNRTVMPNITYKHLRLEGITHQPPQTP